jgi:hypothetical protein
MALFIAPLSEFEHRNDKNLTQNLTQTSRSVLIENTNVLSNLTPLTDERFNYNAMIEYMTIWKLKS